MERRWLFRYQENRNKGSLALVTELETFNKQQSKQRPWLAC